MQGDWFYITKSGTFGDGSKASERSPPESLTQWSIKQSSGFTRKGIEKVSRSVKTYV